MMMITIALKKRTGQVSKKLGINSLFLHVLPGEQTLDALQVAYILDLPIRLDQVEARTTPTVNPTAVFQRASEPSSFCFSLSTTDTTRLDHDHDTITTRSRHDHDMMRYKTGEHDHQSERTVAP